MGSTEIELHNSPTSDNEEALNQMSDTYDDVKCDVKRRKKKIYFIDPTRINSLPNPYSKTHEALNPQVKTHMHVHRGRGDRE